MESTLNEDFILEFGQKLITYYRKYFIPVEYVFEILEDQKVTPMIRGKAMEYNAFLLLDSVLSGHIWSVQKLNLNPQPGTTDEDISITHRRSGVILKIESKSAVRGSFRDGTRSRIMNEPFFKVKCHRSRSSIRLAATTNDRYSVDIFDVILTNPINAIYEGNTIGEELEVIYNQDLRDVLGGFLRHDFRSDITWIYQT